MPDTNLLFIERIQLTCYGNCYPFCYFIHRLTNVINLVLDWNAHSNLGQACLSVVPDIWQSRLKAPDPGAFSDYYTFTSITYPSA